MKTIKIFKEIEKTACAISVDVKGDGFYCYTYNGEEIAENSVVLWLKDTCLLPDGVFVSEQSVIKGFLFNL